MILLDTNILIDYLKGSEKAKLFIQKHEKANLAISTVVAMELYQGSLNKNDFRFIPSIKVSKELTI